MTAQEHELDVQKIRAEISKLMADTAEASARTSKINRETAFYPFAIGAAFFGAAAAFTKLFL